MALQSVEATPVPKEKTPFLVKEAAKHISVCEYLQLRFQRGWDIGSGEYEQIFAAADAVVRYQTTKGEKSTYNLADELELSADPRVLGARLVLTNVPLPKYLTAHQTALESQLSLNYEKIGFYGGQGMNEEAARLIKKGIKLMKDLELTQVVSKAIKTDND